VTGRTLATLAAAVLAALPAAAGAQSAIRAGATLEFDLSGLPTRYEGGAKATCAGTIVTAAGLTPTTCERTFRFEVPPGGTRMAYVFKAASGGETRIELPIVRSDRPATFTAPADGTLQPPAPSAIPPDVAEAAARAKAVAECRACPGGALEVRDVEVTQEPAPSGGSLSVKVKMTPAAAPKK
jgi:hypothetical protein